MEYLIGSLLTILTIVITRRYLESHKDIKSPIHRIRYSQSYIHDMIAPFQHIVYLERSPKTSQSFKHLQSVQLRIIMTERNAYWIKDSAVYKAEVSEGIVVEDSAKVLDMMALDKVELEEVIFIIDKLTEGQSYDNGNTGNP
jgi:hypothetical protein